MSKLSKECEIRRLEGLECLECPCFHYCTMDSCILDIDDEIPEFSYMDREGIE